MNELSMILNPFIKMTDLSLLILIPVSYKKACSDPCSKPAQTWCCLSERPGALLRTDFITDLKNMFQANYKDT